MERRANDYMLFLGILLTLFGLAACDNPAPEPINPDEPHPLSRKIYKRSEPAAQKPTQPHKEEPSRILEPSASNTLHWTNVLWKNGPSIARRELPDSPQLAVMEVDLEGYFGILDIEEDENWILYRMFVDLRDSELPVVSIYTCQKTHWTLLATQEGAKNLQGRPWPPALRIEPGTPCGPKR